MVARDGASGETLALDSMPVGAAPDAPSRWRGLAIGIAAGLIASAVMEAAQAVWLAAQHSTGDGGEPATEKTANAVSAAVTGRPVPKHLRGIAADAVHYATGAAVGGVYGTVAARFPLVTLGFGSVYGGAIAAILDEAIVPALGLGDPPSKVPLATHIFGIASHVVFGVSLEASRRLLGGRR